MATVIQDVQKRGTQYDPFTEVIFSLVYGPKTSQSPLKMLRDLYAASDQALGNLGLQDENLDEPNTPLSISFLKGNKVFSLTYSRDPNSERVEIRVCGPDSKDDRLESRTFTGTNEPNDESELIHALLGDYIYAIPKSPDDQGSDIDYIAGMLEARKFLKQD